MFGNWFRRKKGPSPSFLEAVDHYNHLHIIRLKGALDATAIPELKKFFESETAAEGVMLEKDILIDFKNVGEVDSSTAAQLVHILSVVTRQKRRLALVNLPGKLRKMLEVLKLDGYLAICKNEKEAYTRIMEWSEKWDY